MISKKLLETAFGDLTKFFNVEKVGGSEIREGKRRTAALGIEAVLFAYLRFSQKRIADAEPQFSHPKVAAFHRNTQSRKTREEKET